MKYHDEGGGHFHLVFSGSYYKTNYGEDSKCSAEFEILPSFRSLEQSEEGDILPKPEFDAAKD